VGAAGVACRSNYSLHLALCVLSSPVQWLLRLLWLALV
jgi:hypothetical protein